MEEKIFTELKMRKCVKITVVIITLIIAYLFALNGRYEFDSSSLIIDKWRSQALLIGDDGRYIPFDQN